MLQAADIAADQHIRLRRRNSAQFAGAQLRGQFRLQDGIGAGGTAAQMRFQEGRDDEAGGFQQLLAHAVQLQAVLQRTGGMVGDAQGARRRRRQRGAEFGEIARGGREFGGARLPGRVAGELMGIVLELGRTARGGDQHTVILALLIGFDRLFGPGAGIILAAHMMGQRAATTRALQRHQFDATPRQHTPDSGVDLRTERALHTTGHDGDALLHGCRLGELQRLRSLRPGRQSDARHGAKLAGQQFRHRGADARKQ